MIGTIARVIRGEGFASAMRRAGERIFERPFASHDDAPILNVCSMPLVSRLGGIPIQLRARLEAESTLRNVAVSDRVVGDRVIHLEGTHGVDVEAMLRTRFVVSIHDFTLRDRRLLDAAIGVIFPSAFLRDHYQWSNGVVIEPGVPATNFRSSGPAIAFVGSVKPHKGGALLPDIIRMAPGEWHILGGGDEELLRPLHDIANVYGYYRHGKLPSLLARHRIGLVVLPSIVPETFSLVLSEAWSAGVPVVAFDHGAIAERIRKHGGGWLAPLDSGAEGVAALINQRAAIEVPREIATPMDAARATIACYREWGIPSS